MVNNRNSDMDNISATIKSFFTQSVQIYQCTNRQDEIELVSSRQLAMGSAMKLQSIDKGQIDLHIEPIPSVIFTEILPVMAINTMLIIILDTNMKLVARD